MGILAVTREQTAIAFALGCALGGCASVPGSAAPYEVVGDAIPRSLTGASGDAARGRAVVTGRDGNCLFCHAVPEAGERFGGNIGPSLARIAARFTEGQVRLRIADPTRVNREAVMPAYYRVDGLDAVAQNYRGRTLLTPGQIEDVVAYLMTLN